jgi:hypothetical protein
MAENAISTRSSKKNGEKRQSQMSTWRNVQKVFGKKKAPPKR